MDLQHNFPIDNAITQLYLVKYGSPFFPKDVAATNPVSTEK